MDLVARGIGRYTKFSLLVLSCSILLYDDYINQMTGILCCLPLAIEPICVSTTS